jgi:hypothetical protein
MGAKFQCFVIGLLILNLGVNGQVITDFQSVDSISYKYYSTGNWEELIKYGNTAISKGIDYKYLRQRLGFAYYSKGDYIRSEKHFGKAIAFDSYDSFTLTYLYYSYVMSGRYESATFIAGKMPAELRKSLSIKLFQPLESIDLEYNYKYAASGLRSNPQYYHIGVNSNIGSRLGIYQMFSDNNQTFTVQHMNNHKNYHDQQTEYLLLLKYTLSPHWRIKAGYHYLHPTYNAVTSIAHLGLLQLSSDYGRFNFGINASLLKGSSSTIYQSGLRAGTSFYGALSTYFVSSVSMTGSQTANHFIFDQKAGLRIIKNGWIELNLTTGNLTSYWDHDGLYVYNLIDPTVFRSGGTFYLYSGQHITLWLNYSFERKEYSENSQYRYNQFSYLGGIKWKL